MGGVGVGWGGVFFASLYIYLTGVAFLYCCVDVCM